MTTIQKRTIPRRNQTNTLTTMLRQKRPVVALLVIAFFGIVFLFRGKDNKTQNEAATVTSKKDDDTTTTSNIREEDPPITYEELRKDYCVWSPEDTNMCKLIIASRLFEASHPHRRWLFLGDSTMAQLWTTSSLHEVMLDFGVSQMNEVCSRRFVCEPQALEECNLNQQYDLPTPTEWQEPDWEVLGEGPSSLDNKDCLGCHNCISHFPAFRLVDETRHCRANQRLMYGGYVAMPYARDVILQTPSYRTTQENVLNYIDQHWNNDILHEEFGVHPVCVVRVGLHDMAIPHMTVEKYVTNVKWYLELLQHQCDHVIWLQNTAPLATDDSQQYRQTVQRVRDYDLAVLELTRREFGAFVTTVDVYEASKEWPHSDNIHLDSEWNRALGMTFVKLATKVGTKVKGGV